MSDVTTAEGEGPTQTVRRMPDDQPDVGPYFPSGMNTVEAALAGATSGMSEADIARLKGEEAPAAAEGSEDAESGEADAGADEEAFDPGDYTIDQVLAYVDANPDEVDSVLAAEEAGKARSTLITQLEARQA